MSRATRKQLEKQDQFSGKESPDKCTVKIGRRSICITDKVTENRLEIRQVYSCRLALQFKSRNNNMHPGIAKPKEVSTNIDTSEEIYSSSQISSTSKSTRKCKSDTEVTSGFHSKPAASRRSRIQVQRVLSM